MNINLPSEYDFIKRFFRLTLANVASNIMVPLAGLISVAFLGHLEEIDHLAGVALAGILFEYIYVIFYFLRMGTTGVTAQAAGCNHHEEMLLVGLRNGLLALGLGVAILILQYPIRELWFAIVSATPEVKASGIDYFNARIWGAPAVLFNYVLIGWLLGREMSGKVLLMSLVGNTANVAFDYLYIIQWEWASMGAGIAQALSQYLMLLVGLVLASRDIEFKELQTAFQKLWDWLAFKSTFTLNGNIFVRSLANMTTMAAFGSLSALMGTMIFAENALLLQVILLSIFLVDGIAFTTETLTGNFKGQTANDQFIPLLQLSLGTSLSLGLSIAGACILFPETVFGLLSNHTEVTLPIKLYAPWLILVLGCQAISSILDGYFGGLAEGEPIRNATLCGALLGFAPLAVWAWQSHSNQILWLALSGFMATKMVAIAIQVPRTLQNDPETIALQVPKTLQDDPEAIPSLD
ncbi:guanitoxin biosynthesis MATE family efflux transporter GntT [Kamptonema sp. UHCC 0994]|uniref:guanitoxin biosynthesis MATE family efflux transporter GntT n=1 Tax=Kamptonema sp. UHCC 0994 TaxID=3031329 RepID=UPI0023BAE053|nr:guanitoxin biosynthesis MATE family efflux transporter GntT [Kamptonema sp. UHCC 0994]MDF0556110.1 guanitoxin biosynthesis MATE family efflux transporter GntT [Kamptonema sp. UHCC 0994]